MLLDRGSLAARLAATDDAEVFPITGVLVDGERTIATDGRILAIVEHAPDPEDTFPSLPFAPKPAPFDGPVIVPLDMMGLAAAALPGAVSSLATSRASVTADERGNVAITVATGSGSDVIRGKTIEAKFPDVEEVVPKGKPSRIIMLDARLLGRLAAVAKACGGATAPGVLPVTLELFEDDGPFIVRMEGADRFVGVMMPMRREKPKPARTAKVETAAVADDGEQGSDAETTEADAAEPVLA